jgi:two-component system, chemotaxis family, chemotaxis protein CheY
VDDDPGILATVSEILTLEGYAVATATNGAEALSHLDSNGASLVLLDMRMPVLDGWGFAREVAKRESRPPIVVMTAAGEARQWAREIGADEYVAKPFDISDLLERVRRAANGA